MERIFYITISILGGALWAVIFFLVSDAKNRVESLREDINRLEKETFSNLKDLVERIAIIEEAIRRINGAK